MFDFDAAAEARAKNPRLTVLDTGEMLTPRPWLETGGVIDFDTPEGQTIATVRMEPARGRDGYVVKIVTVSGDPLDVGIDGVEVWADQDGGMPGSLWCAECGKSPEPGEPFVVSGQVDGSDRTEVCWVCHVAQFDTTTARVAGDIAAEAALGTSNKAEINALRDVVSTLTELLAQVGIIIPSTEEALA